MRVLTGFLDDSQKHHFIETAHVRQLEKIGFNFDCKFDLEKYKLTYAPELSYTYSSFRHTRNIEFPFMFKPLTKADIKDRQKEIERKEKEVSR